MATVIIRSDLLPSLPRGAGDLVFWSEFLGVLPRQLRVGGVVQALLKRRQIRVGVFHLLLRRFHCVLSTLRSMRLFIALGVHFECCSAERVKDGDGRMPLVRGWTSWPWTS
jgi:hypothetical protein